MCQQYANLHALTVVEGPSFFVDGGLQIDGSAIASVNEQEVVEACKAIEAEVRLMSPKR